MRARPMLSRFEDPNPLNAPDSEESPVPLPPEGPDHQPPLDEPSKKDPTKPRGMLTLGG